MDSKSNTTRKREAGEQDLLRMERNAVSNVIALSRTPQDLSPQPSDDFEPVDKRAFMQRLRTLASQI